MNISFVNFSYHLDKNLLIQCIKSINRLKTKYPEHNITISVYDQGSNPIGYDFLKDYINPELYHITEWERNGNLNGMTAITGIVDAYVETTSLTNADWIIKIDSDTYVNDLEWILLHDPKTTATVYTNNGVSTRLIGSIYAISGTYAPKIQELFLTRPDIIDRINLGTGPEDVVITTGAREVGGFFIIPYTLGCVYFPANSTYRSDLALMTDEEIESLNIHTRYAITFKDLFKIDLEKRTGDINIALDVMIRYADFIEALNKR